MLNMLQTLIAVMKINTVLSPSAVLLLKLELYSFCLDVMILLSVVKFGKLSLLSKFSLYIFRSPLPELAKSGLDAGLAEVVRFGPHGHEDNRL
jgi:hypothetical protein